MKKILGFTLVELLVTLTVAAILLASAVPAFRDMIQNNRIAVQANAMVGALNLARSEAVKRGVTVQVCKSSNGATCVAGAGNWQIGWIVFSDINGNGVPDVGTGQCVAGEDCLLLVQEALGGNPTLSGPAAVQYTASGRAAAAAVFNHSIPGCTGNQRRTISIALTGRVSIATAAC
jgi:type IV fimbrial biogenesis protein FimT